MVNPLLVRRLFVEPCSSLSLELLASAHVTPLRLTGGGGSPAAEDGDNPSYQPHRLGATAKKGLHAATFGWFDMGWPVISDAVSMKRETYMLEAAVGGTKYMGAKPFRTTPVTTSIISAAEITISSRIERADKATPLVATWAMQAARSTEAA
jgi:hypothetical protein